MRRSEVVTLLAEALLQSDLYGGDTAEREEVREASKMSRLKIAHIAIKELENLGIIPPSIFDPEYYRNHINIWEEE